jgi:hypothetical protein
VGSDAGKHRAHRLAPDKRLAFGPRASSSHDPGFTIPRIVVVARVESSAAAAALTIPFVQFVKTKRTLEDCQSLLITAARDFRRASVERLQDLAVQIAPFHDDLPLCAQAVNVELHDVAGLQVDWRLLAETDAGGRP